MYAPVVTRFVTYNIPRSGAADAYIRTMLADPHMTAWIAAAGKKRGNWPGRTLPSHRYAAKLASM